MLVPCQPLYPLSLLDMALSAMYEDPEYKYYTYNGLAIAMAKLRDVPQPIMVPGHKFATDLEVLLLPGNFLTDFRFLDRLPNLREL